MQIQDSIQNALDALYLLDDDSKYYYWVNELYVSPELIEQNLPNWTEANLALIEYDVMNLTLNEAE
jgi:hypothetical protein